MTQYYLEQNYAHPPPSLVIKTFSTKEITSIIKALETKNSHDEISTKVLKVSATYTGCPRRNVPDFGRMFLMLKYTNITQNTYIQSWTVTEIMAREKCSLLAVPRTAPFQLTRYVYTAHVLETGMQSTLCLRAHVKCLEPQGRLRR